MDVNLGIDESHAFLWITDEGRNQMICNTLEHLEREKLCANNTWRNEIDFIT